MSTPSDGINSPNFSTFLDNTVSNSTEDSPSDRSDSSESRVDHDIKLDTTGLLCPEPLMIVRNKIREMQSGQRLLVLATDPSTHRDFTNFCRFMGHQLVHADTSDATLEFVIRKG